MQTNSGLVQHNFTGGQNLVALSEIDYFYLFKNKIYALNRYITMNAPNKTNSIRRSHKTEAIYNVPSTDINKMLFFQVF